MGDNKIRLPDDSALTGQYVRTISMTVGGTVVNQHMYIYGGLAVKAASATTANVRYYGEALPGTASATSAWRISRVDETSALPVVMWASGTDAFDKDWDSKSSFAYT